MAVLLKAGDYLLVYSDEQYRYGAKGWILYTSLYRLFLYRAILNFPGAIVYHLLIGRNQDDMKLINAGVLAAFLFSTLTFLYASVMGGSLTAYAIKNIITIFIVGAFYPVLFNFIKKSFSVGLANGK